MSNYAIVQTGAKQYLVEPNLVIQVEKIAPQGKDARVELDHVLLVKDGSGIRVGQPLLKGAKVICEDLGVVKGPKVVSLEYRRRKASRNKKGHRQKFSNLLVKEIVS
ncbi:MAG TPA: 50S ribosomal protein L21 [Verrucomicrobiae bacterium]|jgi:large subunit ribosomal protein L21|nr:50S ribosomal protein L21 [Verrucomicrobiae bacterium]